MSFYSDIILADNPANYYRLGDSEGSGNELITVNPSFETGDFTGWAGNQNPPIITSDFAYDGKYSVKFTGSLGYCWMKPSPGQMTLPMGRYKFTCRVKTDNFVTTQAGIGCETYSGTSVQETGAMNVPNGTRDWTLISFIFRVTSATASIGLIVSNAYGGTSIGTIWFDDFHCAPTLARDIVSQNNGVVSGTISLGIQGAVKDAADFAMAFDGTSKILTSGLITLGKNTSIGLWVKIPSGTGNAQEPFISNRWLGGAGSSGLYFGVQAHTLFGYFNTGSPQPVHGNIVIDDNFWHYVTWQNDGTFTTLTVDGVVDVVTAQAITIGQTVAGNFSIGWDNIPNFFTGTVDEVGVFSYPLILNQIKNHVYAANGKFKIGAHVISSRDGIGVIKER